MAKLNYDRDVKWLVERLKKTHGLDVSIKSGVNEWSFVKDGTTVYTGTLREVYCMIQGMLMILDK